MSDSGKQSPLGANVLGSLLQNTGLSINSVASSLMGSSTNVSTYTYGKLITETCLNKLTDAIRLAYTISLDSGTYLSLISIGSTTIPALGNSKSSYYTSSYTGEQTSYGYIRLFAQQAYDEFNFNQTLPEYRDFLHSISAAQSFISYNNSSINTMSNSLTFLEGTYSNMNDLITGDITGVSLSTLSFGKDLINTGKAIDLGKIQTFGLPSNLLSTLKKNSALTSAVSLALIGSGLQVSEVSDILNNVSRASTVQEMKMYQAFTIILGQDLMDVLIPLNCKTKGLESLADLLDVKKLFPLSYQTLTVPLYNTTNVPTNSKTYYLLYTNGAVNSQLSAPNVADQIGTLTPPGAPSVSPVVAVNTAITAFLLLSEQERSLIIQAYKQYVSDSATVVSITSNSVSGGQTRFPFDQYLRTVWYPAHNTNTNVVQNQITSSLVIQPPAVGFGSYLSGILPLDNAIAAGAFSVTMQQIKNITKVDIEKFALVVSNLETTKDLSINGTSVPVNTDVARAGLSTIAVGSGPNGTYTCSDLFGCMSGLPYDWVGIKKHINNIESSNLYVIYDNLYSAIVAYNPYDPGSLSAIQTLIAQANDEIAHIQSRNTIAATELNSLWDITGKQLVREQNTRTTALYPLPIPRDNNLSKFGSTQTMFVDSIPTWAIDTAPHGIAQTLEAISDLSTVGGQSLVAMMRQARNKTRLAIVGIPLDNNISNTISDTQNKILVANGVLPGTIPATLNQTINGVVVSPKAFGSYDPKTNTYDSGYRKNEPIVPGSLADPDLPVIIPQLDSVYFSDTMLSSTMTTQEAIDDVIRCNCDCWDNI